MNKYIFIVLLCVFFSCKDEPKQVIQNSNSVKKTKLNFKKVEDASLYSGSLHRIDSFPSKYVKPRPVDVWLPEDYSEDNAYAVLYMHDGQMLFDSTKTWNKQEWKVDEWASKLMAEDKVSDFIVVAIHNISEIRWQDLFPEKAYGYFDKSVKDSIADLHGNTDFHLNGNNYLKFLVEELKPVVDDAFAVTSNRENTFVMGSSMGGLMSMYAISEYPKVFGGAACLSTHWPGAKPAENNPFPDAIFKYMEDHLPQAGKHKLYFDYGNKTLDQYYPEYTSRVDAILNDKGYSESNAVNLFFDGADHSENSWNQRLGKPLMFLLDQ